MYIKVETCTITKFRKIPGPEKKYLDRTSILQKLVFSPSNLAGVKSWSSSIYQARELNEQGKIDRTIVVSVEKLGIFSSSFFAVFDVQSEKLHRFCFWVVKQLALVMWRLLANFGRRCFSPAWVTSRWLVDFWVDFAISNLSMLENWPKNRPINWSKNCCKAS